MKSIPSKIKVAVIALLVLLPVTAALGAAESLAPDNTDDSRKEKKAEESEKKDGVALSLPFADEKIKVSLGGRVMNDWMWVSAGEAVKATLGSLVSGNEWRAAWIEINGSVYENMEFKFWVDVAGGDADFKDVWFGFKNLPFGSLRIGHMKEPFSLEQLGSLKHITFMERSLADVFAPSRNTGIGVFGADSGGRVTWGAGVFTEADDYGDAKTHNDTYNFSARLTTLPWLGGKDKLLHLGAGFHYSGVNDGSALRFRQRPEAHLSYRFVDTGNLFAEGAMMYGLEAAVQFGPLSIQGEYIGTEVDAPIYGDPSLSAYYVFASYVLTGESRSYRKTTGVFGTVSPGEPFGEAGGIGAWELALRYSQLDLEDGMVMGGVLKDITLGLNWYLNDYARIMWNVVHTDREDIGAANFFQMRFQFNF